MSRSVPFYKTKAFGITVGLLVTVVFMWLAAKDILQDPKAMQQMQLAFRSANYASLPLVLLTLSAFYYLKAWRWRLLLVPIGNYRTARELLPMIMIGFAMNNVLPARMGELVRCVTFSKQQKLPLTTVLSSVVLERILDGLAVVTYLGLGLLFVEGVDPSIRRMAYVASGLSLSLVAAGLVYVIWTKPFVNITEAILLRIPFVPAGLRSQICRLLEGGAQGLASLKSPRLLVAILVISMIKWGLNGTLVYLALWSFGIQVPNPVAVCAVALGAIAFGVAMPSSPGFFGVIQFWFMAVMKLFTSDEGTVFAASIFYHLSQYIPVTLIGLICMFRAGLSLQQVEQMDSKPSPEVLPGETAAATLN